MMMMMMMMIIIIIIIIIIIGLNCNGTIRETESYDTLRDHVLTAEELKSSWLLPLHPRQQSRSTDCLVIYPSDPDNDRITGVKERLSGP
jgi:hypothetical protein